MRTDKYISSSIWPIVQNGPRSNGYEGVFPKRRRFLGWWICLLALEGFRLVWRCRLTKAWTAIDRLSIIWKSDLTDKMKRSFFQAAVVSTLLYGCTTWTLTKPLKKKLDGNCTRTAITQGRCEQYWTSPGSNTPQGTNYTAPSLPSRTLSKLDEPDMQDTAGEAGTSS